MWSIRPYCANPKLGNFLWFCVNHGTSWLWRKNLNVTEKTCHRTCLQTLLLLHYYNHLILSRIVFAQVSGYGSGASTSVQQCSRHATEKLHYFCRRCELSICKLCCTPSECGQHDKVALTRATEESHQSKIKRLLPPAYAVEVMFS